jgi:nitrogen fixation/metabolism regulation signal transduction histidine kinase
MLKSKGWWQSATVRQEFESQFTKLIYISIIFVAVTILISIVWSIFYSKRIATPLGKIHKRLKYLAMGNLADRIYVKRKNDFFFEISEETNNIAQFFEGLIEEDLSIIKKLKECKNEDDRNKLLNELEVNKKSYLL